MMKEPTAERMAAELARAGVNTLLFGPPGTGKTMVARRVPNYLPPPSEKDLLDLAWIYYGARFVPHGWSQGRMPRPFRAPHYTVSAAAMAGTERYPVGEMALAHAGVLYLDELPEFPRLVIDAVARTVRDGYLQHRSVRIPARFMLIGSAMPCPCGWAGSSRQACKCSPNAIALYRDRLQQYMCMLGLHTFAINEHDMYEMPWEPRCPR